MRSGERVVDVHVHMVALPEPGNGCIVSPATLRRPLGRSVMWGLGIDPTDPASANRRYLDGLVNALRASRRVRRSVLLGLDGVYDRRGKLDEARTHILIGNDLVFDVCRRYPELFLPGPSINPMRADALDELERCAAAGAVLIKVLPNSQAFSPADPRCRPFYRRLAELRLPFLTHSGSEIGLVEADPRLGDPALVELALAEGATVISAHGGSTGSLFREKYVGTVKRLAARYPHYYLDSSALCLPNRVGMALALRRTPRLLARLLPGSDFPVPVIAASFAFHLAPWTMRSLLSEANPFDRNYDAQEALGLRFADLPPGSRLAEAATHPSPDALPGRRASEA